LETGRRTHLSNPLAAQRKQESLKGENCHLHVARFQSQHRIGRWGEIGVAPENRKDTV